MKSLNALLVFCSIFNSVAAHAWEKMKCSEDSIHGGYQINTAAGLGSDRRWALAQITHLAAKSPVVAKLSKEQLVDLINSYVKVSSRGRPLKCDGYDCEACFHLDFTSEGTFIIVEDTRPINYATEWED